MGVRYNAEKTTVGKYYSTPIFKFRMKCHLCDNHFEIQTDPKVCGMGYLNVAVICRCILPKSLILCAHSGIDRGFQDKIPWKRGIACPGR